MRSSARQRLQLVAGVLEDRLVGRDRLLVVLDLVLEELTDLGVDLLLRVVVARRARASSRRSRAARRSARCRRYSRSSAASACALFSSSLRISRLIVERRRRRPAPPRCTRAMTSISGSASPCRRTCGSAAAYASTSSAPAAASPSASRSISVAGPLGARDPRRTALSHQPIRRALVLELLLADCSASRCMRSTRAPESARVPELDLEHADELARILGAPRRAGSAPRPPARLLRVEREHLLVRAHRAIGLLQPSR